LRLALDHRQRFTGLALDVELGLVDVDADQGVPEGKTDP
jgi:hypothetical protein